MNRQQSTEINLPKQSAAVSARRRVFPLSMGARFGIESWVMIVVTLITAYLVLPPLYSVIQTSLFTTTFTGELDQFTLRYYEDLLRELRVLGPLLNTIYFSIGSASLATLIGGTVAWVVTRTDTPLRGLGY